MVGEDLVAEAQSQALPSCTELEDATRCNALSVECQEMNAEIALLSARRIVLKVEEGLMRWDLGGNWGKWIVDEWNQPLLTTLCLDFGLDS